MQSIKSYTDSCKDKMKRILLFILINLWAVGAIAQQPLRISFIEYKPFSSNSLPKFGFINEIIREAFAIEGIEVEFILTSPAKAYQSIKNGDIDASSGWAPTEERKAYAGFTKPIYTSSIVLFSHRDNPISWSRLNANKRIEMGVTKNYYYGEMFTKARTNRLFSVQTAVSDKINFKKLIRRRIDAFPISLNAGINMLENNLSRHQRANITYSTVAIAKDPMSLMVSKQYRDHHKVIATFNRGLAKLKASGRYQELIENRIL